MNAKESTKSMLIATRMRRWLDILRAPVVAQHVLPRKARRNYLYLVRTHPEVAEQYGFTEEMAWPGRPPRVQNFDQGGPPNVFPTDRTDPRPTQRPGPEPGEMPPNRFPFDRSNPLPSQQQGTAGGEDSPFAPWTPEDDVL